MDPFDESGMRFGPYPDGHCFRIEESSVYKAAQDGVQMAEFLLLRAQAAAAPVVWIVEAKRSSPRPESQPSFNAFILQIRDKLANALALGVAAVLNRHPNAAAELPDAFTRLPLAATRFRLVLVINGHKEEWLPPLQDALRTALRATANVWALGPNSVVAINEKTARRHGLISAP